MSLMLMVIILTFSLRCNGNQQVAILSPRIIKDPVYKVFLDVNELKLGETLVIALGNDTKRFHGSGDGSSIRKEVAFDVSSMSEDSYQLTSLLIVKKPNGKKICMTQGAKIFSSFSRQYFNLIQTDKPVYKPGDEVRFRVLTLDHDTKPYKYKSISVSVIDANEAITNKFESKRNSVFGFYENSFTLSEEPTFGSWRLEVQIDGKNKISHKNFNVKSFTRSSFNVFIESDTRVAFNDNSPTVELKIYAKNSNENYVKGTATVETQYFPNGRSELAKDGSSKEVRCDNSIATVRFTLKGDFGFNVLPVAHTLLFNVTFTDLEGKKSNQRHKVEALPQGTHEIKVRKMLDVFRPGFTYKIVPEVYKINGKLEQSTSISISMNVEYSHRNKTVTSLSTLEFLKNGKAIFKLQPGKDVTKFMVSFECMSSKVIRYVKAQSLFKEFMQVTYEPKSPKVGDRLKMKTECDGIMEQLNVVAISRGALVYTESFPKAKDKEMFEFELKITKEMAPDSSLIIFYVRDSDGEMVFEEIKLKLGFESGNNLELTPSASVFQPKEETSFKLTTQPQSLVGLVAVDHKNEISKNELISKLNTIGKLKSKHNDELTISDMHVIQPMKSKRHWCEVDENMYFNRRNEILAIPSEEEEEQQPEWEDFEFSKGEEEIVKTIFPSNWIFDSIVVENGETKHNKVLPDVATTWMLSAFSIHPDHGLAIAKPQKIKVYRDFFIKVEAPSSVKVGEVFKVEVALHNYLNSSQDVQVTLHEGDFELLGEKLNQGGCNEFFKTQDYKKRIEVNSQIGASVEYIVRAVSNKNLNLQIDAAGREVRDSVIKVIKVDQEGVTRFKSFPIFVDLTKINNFREIIPIKVPTETEPNTFKVRASISGNVLSPIMESPRDLTAPARIKIEQRLKAFAISIYGYKFIKSLNNSTAADSALNSLIKSYQDIKALQSQNGAFKLGGESDSSKGIWFTAYAAQLFGDARDLTDVIDGKFCLKSLNYLNGNQINDQYFEDDVNFPRKIQGQYQHHRVHLTAFVMIAIAKNKEDINEYGFIIKDGVEFLSNLQTQNDYEKAIVAYAFALSDEKEKATKILNELKWNFENIESEVKALQVEIASYVVLAAVHLKRFVDAKRAFNWLIRQRRPDGGFFSTHDTVLGHQAISAMQEYFGVQNSAMNIKFTPGSAERIENEIDSKFIDLPSNSQKITVTANGRGLAYVNVFYQYQTKSVLSNSFSIILEPIEESENNVKLNFKVGCNKPINIGIVEVELPSGFEYRRGKFSEDVKKFELNEDKTRVILYFDKMTNAADSKPQVIEATKFFVVKESRKSLITAYDFYEPEFTRTNRFYGLKSCTRII